MQNFRSGFWKHLIRFAGIVFVLSGLSVLPVSAQEILPNLFSEADPNAAQIDLAADYNGEVIRARWAEVDLDLVAQMASSWSQTDGEMQPDFTFNLFPDVRYPAYIQGVDALLNGAVGIYGKVSEGAVSEFVLLVNKEVMHAYLQDGLNTYEVRYQNGGHLIVEVDSSRYPDSMPSAPAPDADAVAPAEAAPLADTGDDIDILAVYTPAARDAVGGVSAIEARILASIESTNLGYANSGVIQRVRLAGMALVNYEEDVPGYDPNDPADAQVIWSYALYRLAFGHYDTDPVNANYLADARNFRDTNNADLVFMVTNLPYTYCGLGFLGGDPDDEAVGYSVEHWNCTGASSFTVQHEMGHNMGACHDRDNTDGGTIPFCYGDYSFGYWLQGGEYYTVMAYPCEFCTTRINYWSNPNVLYAGTPTGVDVGSPNSAYNTLTLNNTAYNVANYRLGERVSVNFKPAGNYGILDYRSAVLDVDSSSLDGDIVRVVYRAYYDDSWHVLKIDTNPGDGWAYTWNTFALRGQVVSLQAVARDDLGQDGVTQIDHVLVDYGWKTKDGYTGRGGGRGSLGQPSVEHPVSDVFFPDPIPVDAEAAMSYLWPVKRAPQGKMPPIQMQ